MHQPDRTHHRGPRAAPPLATGLLLAAVLLALSPPASADDRDLLRVGGGRPYVFIVFDTSGSMHFAPRCTAEQQAAGECAFPCPTGDCATPLNGDDPASKLYQAKQALFEVLEGVDGVDFGFATFNQDGLHLRAKHWLYEATGAGPVVPGIGGGPYPAIGTREVFGLQWACDVDTNPNDTGDDNIGCYPSWPADLDDAWEVTRVRRLPKGGIDFNGDRRFFIRTGGIVYRLTYHPQVGPLGAPLITVEVILERCDNSGCTGRTELGRLPVVYRRIGDFDSWDAGVERDARRRGFFDQAAAADSPATDTCAGWDPNDDGAADGFPGDGYNLRWPTTVHPEFSPALDSGDVLPLSWETDNRRAILERLAPNLAVGEQTPDFRTARYFEDVPDPGAGHLDLEDERARPLIAFGSTPLGAAIRDFRTWYAGCDHGSCPHDTGWRDLAAERDPDWGCRRKFLLVLTDGDDSCGGGNSACSAAAALRAQESIKTYVVAFGVQGGGNALICMADSGGTGEPMFPQNRQQLVDALNRIFGEISEETIAFGSATLTSAQAADAIYLTSATPLDGASVWDGHVDAYLAPLPLTADGRPDRDRECGPSDDSQCHAWDAGEKMLAQAPTEAEVLADVYKLGNQVGERRVFYPFQPSSSSVPGIKRLLLPPADSGEEGIWRDLLDGMGIPVTGGDPASLAAAKTRARNAIRFTLKQKRDTVEVDGVATEITHLLGDAFHSFPELMSAPERADYFDADLYGNGGSCTDTIDPNRGYRCFADRHRYRRRVLLVGSNDGQLHALDAGRFDGSVAGGQVEGEFDNGSGREIFSIVPRTLLPTVVQLAESRRHDWGLDGTVRVDDVFIDPLHDGTPDPGQRQWRTVGIVGFREGGAGYLAVDLTRPDRFEPGALAQGFFIPDSGGDYVPSCLKSYTAASCGPVGFPQVLWELDDTEVPDEDLNAVRDLGDTWSIPASGRIRVIEDGEPADKFVAVLGGGMDPAKTDSAGDWLYVVDVETGKPIYKRQLVGSAPSEPAAVDTDRDGYLDTLYIGTTAGLLYKADVGTPAEIHDLDVLGTTVRRIDSAAWEPFVVFDTGGRPIYFPPAVTYVAELDRWALGFGTGDREDLWSQTGQDGRFYLILDEGFAAGDTFLPLDETHYQPIPAVGGEQTGHDRLLDPEPGRRPGWFIELGAEERLISKPFSASGVTVFTSYLPEVQVVGDDDNPPRPGAGNPDAPVCAKTGRSRIFVVVTASADAVLTVEGEASRFLLADELVTDPFIELSTTELPVAAAAAR